MPDWVVAGLVIFGGLFSLLALFAAVLAAHFPEPDGSDYD